MNLSVLAKSKPDDEPRKHGIPKSELLELKDRLARTEAALTKLMEATKLISDKIDPKGKAWNMAKICLWVTNYFLSRLWLLQLVVSDLKINIQN